ncbi:MAG: DUF3089 domain-containing protein [Bacteroidia bacterium]|jgi:hypothetical protein|nr:DUF3089 domain-containing protein [Bacteroidia bacterium]
MFRHRHIILLLSLCLASCIKPWHNFEHYTPPPAPDYSKDECWAALPWKHSTADTVLPGTGVTNCQDSAKADVFFIYPTLYFGSRSWNADVYDKKLNRKIEQTSIAQQASVFNGSCKIYIPRYRQATLYAFLDKKDNGVKALNLAYSDVSRAFKYYMEHFNHGRPVIIAGHSQGSLMAYRLLKEFFDTTALRNKLVAAYPIGYRLCRDSLKNIPPGDSATQTGCCITWNSVRWGGLKNKTMSKHFSGICINPLSWKEDTAFCSDSLNKGSLVYTWGFKIKGLAPHIAGAMCRNGELWIKNSPKAHIFSIKGSYHIFDYSLFYMNLRDNVRQRVEAYLGRHR